MNTAELSAAAVIEALCAEQLVAVHAESLAVAGAEPALDCDEGTWATYSDALEDAEETCGVAAVRERAVIAENDLIRAFAAHVRPLAKNHAVARETTDLCDQILAGKAGLTTRGIVLKSARALAAKAARK